MGIGISYTGHDGKKRDFSVNSVEEAKAGLDSVMRAGRVHTGNALKDAMVNMGNPTTNNRKGVTTMPGGSVVSGRDGLCLRGEEYNPLVEGVKLFSSVNGSKGFHSIGDIDPPTSGALIGATFDCDDEDANNEALDFSQPGKIIVGGRVKMVKDDNSKMVTLYQMMKEISWSKNGRCTKVSGEKRRVVGSFNLAEDSGSGEGKYGVRLFYTDTDGDPVHPTPVAMAFGTEANLDTWNEDTQNFACNYNDSGVLLEDPPVKVIGISLCTGGVG